MTCSPHSDRARFIAQVAAALFVAAAMHLAAHGQTRDSSLSETESLATRLELSGFEKRAIELTNQFRQKHELGNLAPQKSLMKVARYFAEYMAHTSEYGHEADGDRPAKRVERFGYEHCLVAENIAYRESQDAIGDRSAAERFYRAWEVSKSHRRNMLEPDFTEIGVALGFNEATKKYYAVQVLARPASAMIKLQLVNETANPVRYHLSGYAEPLEIKGRVIRTHHDCRPIKLRLAGEAAIKVSSAAKYVIKNDDGEITLVKE